jgi:hypothetical protein
MAVRLSALRAGRYLPPGRFLVLNSVRDWVYPRAIVRRGGQETISSVLKVPRQCPLVLLVEVVHMIWIIFVKLERLHCNEIWYNIRRAACEACSATCNLGTKSVLILGPKKTTENLDQVGTSQDVPDANSLLASSPELNTRTNHVGFVVDKVALG